MATLQELERALVNAHNAGDSDAARKLAVVIKSARENAPSRIPDAQVPGTEAPKPEATIGQEIVGAGEAGLAAVTGATGGAVGMAGGMLKGMAEEALAGQFGTPQAANRIEQQAMRGAEALTYAPRTDVGQQRAAQLSELASVLPPVIPLAGELSMAMQGARPTAMAAATAGRAALPAAAQRIRQVAAPIERAVSSAVEPMRVRVGETFGAGSTGAAETPASVVRREAAAQTPVPFTGEAALTKGQASREFDQLQFEKESAKLPQGRALRERASNQAEVLQQNFDAMVDVANPEYLDPQSMGKAVDRALVNKTNQAKRQISAAYRAADEAGELSEPVPMDGLGAAINDVEQFRPFVEKELAAIERQAIRMGALVADADGQLTPGRIALRDSETLRQYINDAIDWTDKRQALVGRRLKDGIDAATENSGGDLYREARGLRRRYAQEFENSSLAKKLLTTKRGTDERNIAVEDVFDKVIVKSSLEEMNKLRGTLLKAGPDGKRAWANLKAKGIDQIKEASLSASQTDERGNPILSPDRLNREIAKLDQDGKLESLYGKKQAQTIRDLGELANVIYTAPPGAINTSNTASALRVALDSFATFMFTGVPAPAATALREAAKYAKDRKTRIRIEEALRTPQKQDQAQPRF